MNSVKQRMAALIADLLQDEAIAIAYREAANEEIGAALRVARERAGLSQEDVATRMGVSRPRVSQIEGSEGSGMTLGVLRRFVEALDCALNIEIRDPQRADAATPIYVVGGLPEGAIAAGPSVVGEDLRSLVSGSDYSNANYALAA